MVTTAITSRASDDRILLLNVASGVSCWRFMCSPVPLRSSVVVLPEPGDQHARPSASAEPRQKLVWDSGVCLSSRPRIDSHRGSEPECCFDLRPRFAKPALILLV